MFRSNFWRVENVSEKMNFLADKRSNILTEGVDVMKYAQFLTHIYFFIFT